MKSYILIGLLVLVGMMQFVKIDANPARNEEDILQSNESNNEEANDDSFESALSNDDTESTAEPEFEPAEVAGPSEIENSDSETTNDETNEETQERK